jgi:DNA-binding MarR family transcriptional regulator
VDENGGHHVATTAAPGVDPVAAEAVEAFFTLLTRMRAYYGRVCESFGLSPQLASVLRGLATPSPMRELARRLHVDASNLTGLVDRLEERGLVERRPDPDDRRVKQLTVTPDGAELRDALNAGLMADPPLFAGLSPQQRRDLRHLLRLAAGTTATETVPDCVGPADPRAPQRPGTVGGRPDQPAAAHPPAGPAGPT